MVDNITILTIVGIAIALFCIILGKYISNLYMFSKSPEIPSEAKQYYDQFIKKKKNILILTAHPDDECMFFSPTIKCLSRTDGIEIHILCFTNGNYDGLGKIREKELKDSTSILGVYNTVLVNSSEFNDGPNEIWDLDMIGEEIDKFVTEHSINKLITFDDQGVSGHANHISLYRGAKKYMMSPNCPKDLLAYSLKTTNIVRKYISILDVPFSYSSSKILFISGWMDIFTSVRAMLAHKSQMVWFRYLYILTSRYMIVNTLQKI